MRFDTLAWHLPYPYEISAELIGQDIGRRSSAAPCLDPPSTARDGRRDQVSVAAVYAVAGKDALRAADRATGPALPAYYVRWIWPLVVL
ncbi:MAG: hypothetical protein WKF58_19240 [Ilumatobacteraceae bacterium]